MKSKTPRISKNSASKSRVPKNAENAELSEVKIPSEVRGFVPELAIGYNPPGQLKAQDAQLFKSFQSNLLSLISHELRTPLMGILNSLSLLEEPEDMGLSRVELLRMARQNAQRLNQTLASLLDLAAIESGTFHARLREVDFSKTVRSRVGAVAADLKVLGIQLLWDEKPTLPLLADPQRLSRAIDLCLQAIMPRTQAHTALEIRITPAHVEFWFQIKPELQPAWEQSWLEALTGHEGGVSSPSSAFAGVLQSEQAFLTRQEEGLGSEFLLVHEIMKIHLGDFSERKEKIKGLDQIALVLQFPEVTSEEGLRAVLSSRAYDVSIGLKSVALVLMDVPDKADTSVFCSHLKSHLFRASDAVYPLPEKRQAGIVLDDCPPGDIPLLMARLKKQLGESFVNLAFGSAHCPSDGLEPSKLLDLAQARLTETHSATTRR